MKHQQNLVERFVQTIKNGMRTVMSYNNSPVSYWDDALDYYIFTDNNLPHYGNMLTREEEFTGIRSDMSSAVPFHADGYYSVTIAERSNIKPTGKVFSDKGEPCKMLGYPIGPN